MSHKSTQLNTYTVSCKLFKMQKETSQRFIFPNVQRIHVIIIRRSAFEDN